MKTQPSTVVKLRRSGGGVFEILVDERLAWSKKATGQFPTEQDVAACVAPKPHP